MAVADLLVDGRPVPANDPRRTGGWYGVEDHWQWTDGDAGLAIAGARYVEVTLLSILRYWDTNTTRAKLAAR